MSDPAKPFPDNFLVRVVRLFLTSRLSILLVLTALCLGAAAILITPREEEPQIVVPLADIFVQAPGASAAEVEKLVATPLERLLWQIDGVEYVYSISRTDMAIVTVRFYVGEDRENSLLKLHSRIAMHIDQAPPIVRGWVIKPVEIDDVSIVNLTLYSAVYDDFELRRMGEEVLARLSEVKNISATEIVGGRQRQIRVEVFPERLSAYGISLPEVELALQAADESTTAGTFSRNNREYVVTSHAFLTTTAEVAGLVVGVYDGRPVYLRDVARVQDGPCEVQSYTRIGFSRAWQEDRGTAEAQLLPPDGLAAVTLALAKKQGTNAVTVARDVLRKMDEITADWLPEGVHVEVTRNYGRTAQEKVNGLLSSLGFAIITVVILLALVLGWREATVVALAVPISFCLALFVNYLFGYTINRVTLFALILSLGLVVDDPITNVDNIQRHILQGRFDALKATLFGVAEVLPPVLMSTLAIIVCFTPLFFITGMMGPYMAPMAANVPLTVIFSTVCALSIVPWLTYHLLKNRAPRAMTLMPEVAFQPSEGISARLYHGLVGPLLDSRGLRYLLLLVVLGLLLVSMSLALLRMVPLKMLPFDNKDEFQIVVDMPEGTTLETTHTVMLALKEYLSRVPEVTSFISYTGTASPIDFNGMVRHYYLRQGAGMGDIRVNLRPRRERQQQSHAIVLRLRTDLEAIGRQHGANIKLIEVPPGPPVLSTIVAEIYGASDKSYADLVAQAAHIRELMASEPFVVDLDDTTEAPRQRLELVIDREKAALHGVSTQTLVHTIRTAVGGSTPAMLHVPDERQPLMIQVILPRAQRSGETALLQLPIKSADGRMIPLAELVSSTWLPVEQSIYHKNLERVVYVMAEMAGRAPAEAILDMQQRLRDNPPPEGISINWSGEGEWKITLEVFRDMGIAFAAALLGIYLLLIIQTNSFFMPLLIMMAIPLTLLGIMPGFYLLNLLTATPVGGFENPVFFTATSMIGMIALGGIVIRNSLILIEFIQDAVSNGVPLRDAILECGVIRMRPILLTAATTALGAWPITLDPVFSGLAWALIFGLLASTCFTLVIIPVTYYALFREE